MNIITEIKRIKKLMQLNEEAFDNVIIRPYKGEKDFDVIFTRLPEVYKMINWPAQAIWNEISPVDEQLSIIMEVNGKVGGFYFLREESIPEGGNKEAYETLKNLKGVEGVALGVFDEYKNLGLGRTLINYPSTMGYDYVWGYQLKSLENIDNWLKRRKLYAETNDLYITYEIFNSNEQSNQN